LGEALSLRARQAQQLEDLRGRIKSNALVQEGDEPAESVPELLEQFEKLSDEHAETVQRIIRTNVGATASNGENILSMLHLRESLRRKRSIHEMVANVATPGRDVFRYRAAEIKYVPQVKAVEHRTAARELDQAIARIDAVLQETAWQVDLA